ncbi:MAG: PEP/pyruvate-binding domain-containing protein [Ignavibacteriales bacterium]|nr:PEP/pyruvate-binding domain-containing protein [Ignavibacteriales bacterium]
MNQTDQKIEKLVYNLQERTKELNCIYSIEELLKNSVTQDDTFQQIVEIIPSGWQYNEKCEARIVINDRIYKTKGYKKSKWEIRDSIIVQGKNIGEVAVSYNDNFTDSETNPFLKEEVRLLNTIAVRLGHFILYQSYKNVFEELKSLQSIGNKGKLTEWKIALDMIKRTDPYLFGSIMRKILYQLCIKRIEAAKELLKKFSVDVSDASMNSKVDENKPLEKKILEDYEEHVIQIIELAEVYFDSDEILSRIQKWTQEDRLGYLIKAAESQTSALTDIIEAIRKYRISAGDKFSFSPATEKGLKVSLLRRFFTDNLEFLAKAKYIIDIIDFYEIIDRIIYPQLTHGRLGGKSSGLFLASHSLKKSSVNNPIIKDIKTPKTWYIVSDGILSFMHYNNLEEVLEQKYKDIEEVKIEYPYLIQVFKNSNFPPELIKGLSIALDDFGDKPIIVRSSSLLEDQMGAAFSGKYKSLFIANKGTKSERLSALIDAISEVYASTFGPDPIEYRAERGLLEFNEEMGIMIQEVVGTKIGKYYIPSFAGVAFSNNEFRWSPRIKRDDGLLRLVAGLGTRAVDRLSTDFPILIAPGQPNLRVNVKLEEFIKYSPKMIDVINLETNQFETIEIKRLLRELGIEYPGVKNVFSVLTKDNILKPIGFDTDFIEDEIIVSFDGLLSKTNFIKKIDAVLKTLKEQLKTPVDIEFAHDGKDFYLLQCRPQSYGQDINPDEIPSNIDPKKILFTANKFISNGRVPPINYIVYVDPNKYSELTNLQDLLAVGRAVGKLNKILPKREFILMGPGRWGSRGDVKLGVSVTYSDINNTAMLIEIAKKKGNYVPDLSFGTHFFQDLVEAAIRYLPLYPDDEDVVFNEEFFNGAKNSLINFAPEFTRIADTLKIIDISAVSENEILKVLINADVNKAVAVLMKKT